MLSDYNSADFMNPTTPTCYFSIAPSYNHFSVETPSTSPLSAYLADSIADPAHPLLAYRSLPSSSPTTTAMDASKLLQMQTQAANVRPSAQYMQHSSSSSSHNSNSSSHPPSGSCSPTMEPMVCCSRCRRSSTSQNNMVPFGTNLYYCRHCASMVGFSHG
jgi:hypothetical protein